MNVIEIIAVLVACVLEIGVVEGAGSGVVMPAVMAALSCNSINNLFNVCGSVFDIHFNVTPSMDWYPHCVVADVSDLDSDKHRIVFVISMLTILTRWYTQTHT